MKGGKGKVSESSRCLDSHERTKELDTHTDGEEGDGLVDSRYRRSDKERKGSAPKVRANELWERKVD